MQAQKYSIKQWSPDARPREKLRSLGEAALSNAELIAILLQSGHGNQTVLDLAHKVLAAAGNQLTQLGKLNINDLKKIPGIGEVRAMVLLAAFELGRRRQVSDMGAPTIIRNSQSVANYLQTLLKDYRHEIFGVLFLNRANRINHFEIISQGGISSTVVDTKIIIRKALEHDATNLILFHNHPSGSLQPSDSDETLTQKLFQAAALFEIRVLDHLIVSQDGYFSFADEKKL